MVHRAKELSFTHQAFVDECMHLKSMFHHLGYPSSLVNGIIDKCDNSSSPEAETKSDKTLRVSILFKDQVSANMVKRRMRDRSSKIGIGVQPIYSSKKLEQDLQLKEIKPCIVNQHSLVYCDLSNVICVIQITSDIRRTICFNALLIIDTLPLVAT